MAKVCNLEAVCSVLNAMLDSDLTFHKVRTDLWTQLVKTSQEAKGDTFQISLSEWTTLKGFLTARNEKAGSEAALAFEKTLIQLVERAMKQREQIASDSEDEEQPKVEQPKRGVYRRSPPPAPPLDDSSV